MTFIALLLLAAAVALRIAVSISIAREASENPSLERALRMSSRSTAVY